MNLNKFLKYFAYSLLLFGITLCCIYINNSIQRVAAETYDYSKYIFFITFLYVPIGICLGIPQLFNGMKKAGHWKINIAKLILIGLPALYFSAYLYIHFHIPFLQLPNQFAIEVISQIKTTIIANVILGYILTTSFDKE